MSFETGTGDAGDVGDILPTLVTADDARRYIGEVDAQWKQLDQDVRASSSTTDEALRRAFANDFVGWLTFRDDARENVGFLNAKATMEQTDRWAAKIGPWRSSLRTAGAKVTGPDPTPAGQGVANPSAGSGIKTAAWLLGGALVVASVVAVGYVASNVRRVAAVATKVKAAV